MIIRRVQVYKITNNKIKIGRGETPTYSRAIIFKDGSPYRLNVDRNNPFIEFVVRPSVYSKKEDYVLKIYIDLSDKHKFEDTDLVFNKNQKTWIGYKPDYVNRYKLHTIQINNINQYKYYKWTGNQDPDFDEWESIVGEWVDYDFVISFQFPYYQMSTMEAKPYSYEVSLLDGVLLSDYIDIPIEDRSLNYPYEVIDYKKILLPPTEFFVGGSMSGK